MSITVKEELAENVDRALARLVAARCEQARVPRDAAKANVRDNMRDSFRKRLREKTDRVVAELEERLTAAKFDLVEHQVRTWH